MSQQRLLARRIASETFAPYGQVIFPVNDGKPFDATDAQLDIGQGTPRLYLMRLYERGRKFREMARHERCTQCLGSLAGKEWLLAVAPPTPNATRPDPKDIVAVRVPGNCFVKLGLGTWHAGPYFDGDFVDFYNLELSDTNLSDRLVYNFYDSEDLEFEIL